MTPQLIIGLNAEGSTDYRFLKEIIFRAFDDIISRECAINIDIWSDILIIDVPKTTFIETALSAALDAGQEYGASILCIHADADKRSTQEFALNNKINPFLDELEKQSDAYCKVIIPVIPITMTEAWMMADNKLLKTQIKVLSIPDAKLNLDKKPENHRDPKAIIQNAIDVSNQNRRKRIASVTTIDSLYEDLGNMVPLDALRQLPSYLAFEDSVRAALRQLNYLH
jgi:hypothetical protein